MAALPREEGDHALRPRLAVTVVKDLGRGRTLILSVSFASLQINRWDLLYLASHVRFIRYYRTIQR